MSESQKPEVVEEVDSLKLDLFYQKRLNLQLQLDFLNQEHQAFCLTLADKYELDPAKDTIQQGKIVRGD